jgi:hypothetical protein
MSHSLPETRTPQRCDLGGPPQSEQSVQPSLFGAGGDVSRRPTCSAQLVPRFVGALRDRGWVAGARLAVELEADLRTLRDAAHHSDGLILGGNRGYFLTLQASIEDVVAVTNRLMSQSRHMRERAMEIERVRHRCVRDVGGAA